MAVLERVETDLQEYRPDLVREIFSLIKVSRKGLYEREILEITGIPMLHWTRLANAVEPHLLRMNGRLNFAHDSFRGAVEGKYLSDKRFKEQCHLKLAEYFNRDMLSTRSLNELPYHLLKNKAWEKVQDYLSDMNVFFRFSTDQKRYDLLYYWNEMPKEYNRPGEKYLSALEKYEKEKPTEIEFAHACNQIGEFLFITGEFKVCESVFMKSLKIREKVLGPVHPDIAESLNNMAAILDQRGAFSHAAELYQKSLEMNEKIYGASHASNVVIMNNLAVTLINTNGNLEKAEMLFQRALDINEKQYGKLHDQTSLSISGLAMINKHKGEYEKAESHFKEALEIRKTIFGESHSKTMSTLEDMALLYYWMGDYAKAYPLLEETLKTSEQRLSEKHPGTLSNMMSLSSLCLDMLEFEKAENLIQKSLKLSEIVFGTDHYKTLGIMSQQARLMSHKGDFQQAESLLRKVLETTIKAFGTESLNAVSSRLRLSELLIQTGKYSEARELLEQVHEVECYSSKEFLIIENTSKNRIDQSYFSNLLVAAGCFELAEPILKKLYLKSKNSLGHGDPDTQVLKIDLDIARQWCMGSMADSRTGYPNDTELQRISLEKITLLNRQANKFAELNMNKNAIPFRQRSLEIATIGFGPNHPETGMALEKLADLHLGLKNFQWVLYLFRQQLHVYSICFGADHLKTAEAINNVAMGYYRIGDFDNALVYFKDRLKILEIRLGLDHSETIKARNNLIGLQTASSFM